ncbi:hypothetical protein [Tatumella punctata]|uniref:Uncharacterized protein n=1 Tax=Tatumella punctata TaxID=399969 RepID=A0ABW1VMP2_9GAMM
MPRIPIYQSQVGINAGSPSVVHTPTETTDQQMVQQGVNSFADAAVKLAQQQQSVQRSQYNTAINNSDAALQQDMITAQGQSKTGTDYIPMVQNLVKQHQDAFFAANPSMSTEDKARYQDMWSSIGAQRMTQAINWGQGQAQSITVTNLTNTADSISNAELSSPGSSKALQQNWIDNLQSSDLNPATKSQLLQKAMNSWEYGRQIWAANNAPQHLLSQYNTGSDGTLADRNNNLLNIRYSPNNNWVGKGGDNGTGFEQFDTPEHGLRAGIKLMQRQIGNGNNTIQSLISKWAPSSDNNNPVQYAQAVSKATGIPLDQQLNPSDPQQMTSIARAMATQEGYSHEITDDQLQRAWDAVSNPGNLASGINPGVLTLAQTESVQRMAQANVDRQFSQKIAMQNQQLAMQTKMENAASHATDTMQTRIAGGQIPSPDDWQNYEQMTQGTSYQGSTDILRNAMVQTQRLYSMPPAQAQEELQKMQVDLKNNGGSQEQYKIFDLVQKGINQRQADVQKNPQSVWAMDSGQPLQPVDPDDALNNPGQLGQQLTQRLINSSSIAQKYGPTAGKNLLTTDELHNFQDAYARMGADQRIQFWRNTQASSSPAVSSRLATEMGGDSPMISAVAGLANTPSGYSAALSVEKGNQLMNPKDGAAKVTFPPTFDSSLQTSIKSEYPGMSAAQVQRMIPLVKAYHLGSGGDPQGVVGTDELHSVIGTPVKISGASVIAPPGTNVNSYKDSISTGINGLGSMSDSVRNGLSNGTYSLVPDINGNQMLISAASQRKVIGQNGKPVVIEVSQ